MSSTSSRVGLVLVWVGFAYIGCLAVLAFAVWPQVTAAPAEVNGKNLLSWYFSTQEDELWIAAREREFEIVTGKRPMDQLTPFRKAIYMAKFPFENARDAATRSDVLLPVSLLATLGHAPSDVARVDPILHSLFIAGGILLIGGGLRSYVRGEAGASYSRSFPIVALLGVALLSLAVYRLWLESRPKLPFRSGLDEETLVRAAKLSRQDVIDELLKKKGLDVNWQDWDHQSALMYAAETGNLQVVSRLVASRADANLKTRNGVTALMFGTKHSATAKFLVNAGADVKSRTTSGMSVLDWALHDENRDLATFLLEKGAEANTRAEDGQTPLMRAAAEGFEDIVQTLLTRGADVNAKTAESKGSWYWCLGSADDRKGVNVGAGITALMCAASRFQNLRVVETLIDRGADVNLKTADGLTALAVARKNHHSDIAELLMKRGARGNE